MTITAAAKKKKEEDGRTGGHGQAGFLSSLNLKVPPLPFFK